MLINEARFRGKPFLTAWLPPVSRCLFSDRRRQCVVIEPRSDRHGMIRDLRCGDGNIKEFRIPSQTRHTAHAVA